ncbi:hypothetical protein BJ912DRAFT_982420 [Pholiota molesta]|nr:hypothetical protein BJ912DRAFT_982420 [Pholiota molesta]
MTQFCMPAAAWLLNSLSTSFSNAGSTRITLPVAVANHFRNIGLEKTNISPRDTGHVFLEGSPYTYADTHKGC